MDFLNTYLSSTMQFIVVFVLILGLLVPLVWRWYGAGSHNIGPRGRRLTVIESAPVDVRHRLVLVKRDNVEHLLLIGGPASVVVESGISRSASRDPRPIPDARTDAARNADLEWALPEPVSRPVPMVDLDAALPEPPARTAREAMADSMRAVRSGTAARRGPPADHANPEDAAQARAPENSRADNSRTESARTETQRADGAQQRPDPRRAAEAAPPPPPPNDAASRRQAQPPRTAPPAPPRQAPPVPAPPPSSDEGNFAEMTQRLEAALRRTPKADTAPQRRQDPALAGRRPPPPADARRAKSDAPPDLKVLSGKGQNELAMENLEDEMAKMLGRSAKS